MEEKPKGFEKFQIRGYLMMLEYVAMDTPVTREGGEGAVGSSGIAAYENRSLVAEIGDITPDFAEAARLADMLNRYEVSLLHFRDVVEDYIAQR